MRLGIESALCSNLHMKQKSLIETNPYLRDPEKFRKALITNVSSSAAVETGASVEAIARTLIEGNNPTRSRNRKAPLDNFGK